MTVADIEVEDPAAGFEQCVDLLTEVREVGRVERRLDLAPAANPGIPSHGSILRRPHTPILVTICHKDSLTATCSRAMKKPLVR